MNNLFGMKKIKMIHLSIGLTESKNIPLKIDLLTTLF